MRDDVSPISVLMIWRRVLRQNQPDSRREQQLIKSGTQAVGASAALVPTMSRVATVRRADLDRAIKALTAAGYTVERIELAPAGTVVIVPGLTGCLSAQLDELSEWRARRDARAAERRREDDKGTR